MMAGEVHLSKFRAMAVRRFEIADVEAKSSRSRVTKVPPSAKKTSKNGHNILETCDLISLRCPPDAAIVEIVLVCKYKEHGK